MHLRDWQYRIIGEWADRTFGHSLGKVEDIPACLEHLQEEVDELKADPSGEEIADCIILLLTIGHCLNVDVEAALLAKHTVNTMREWQPPNERGVVHHV